MIWAEVENTHLQQAKNNKSVNICIALEIVYAVCTDGQWEDWKMDNDSMWSSRSVFDICMFCSNILQNKKK